MILRWTSPISPGRTRVGLHCGGWVSCSCGGIESLGAPWGNPHSGLIKCSTGSVEQRRPDILTDAHSLYRLFSVSYSNHGDRTLAGIQKQARLWTLPGPVGLYFTPGVCWRTHISSTMPLPLRGLRYYVAVRKGQFDCGGEREATCVVTVCHWDMTRGRFVVEQVLAEASSGTQAVAITRAATFRFSQ